MGNMNDTKENTLKLYLNVLQDVNIFKICYLLQKEHFFGFDHNAKYASLKLNIIWPMYVKLST